MNKKDIEERKEFRDMLTELYYVVTGDDTKGLDGIVQRQKKTLERIENIEKKLQKDHDLLWWNRTADGVWCIIKKPILYLITFAIIVSVIGGNGFKGAWDYIQIKLGIK